MNTLLRCAMTVAAIGLSVGRVNADTVTWVGPASGGNWSESANWQDGAGAARAPGTDDIATFPATTTDVTLDAATAVKGVKIVAAFTLNGTEKLTLGADGIDTASSSTATVTVYVPLELSSGDVKFTTSTSSSGKLYLEGVISGSGRLYQYGMGPVHLKCANTFTGGVRSCGTGSANSDSIRVYEGTSLGGPDADGNYGTVTLETANGKYGGIRIMNNMTIANPFLISNSNGGKKLIYFGSDVSTANASVNNGEVVFMAPFTIYGSFSMNALSSNTLRVRFLKPFSQKSTAAYCDLGTSMQNNDSSSFHFEGGLFLGTGYFSADGHGKICLYKVDEPNTWAYASCQSPCICCYGTNVLPTTSGSYIEVYNYGAGLDLRGFSQKVPRFRSKSSAVNTLHTLKSSTGGMPVLEVTNGGNDLFGGIVQDSVTFCWNPASANTMKFSTQTSTTTGDLIVSNGVIQLTAGAKFTKIGAVRVSDGAEFKMDAGSSINSAAAIYVYGTGKVTLPDGADQTVSDVFVDGSQIERGETYVSETATTVTGTRVPWLAGEAVLRVAYGEVTPSTATWDGGAGASVTSVGDAENWEGNVLPALTSGGLTATFASAGAAADIDRNVTFYGINFSAPDDGFTLTDGGGRIRLRDGGITAAAGETEKTYTIKTPVLLDDKSQTWTVNKDTAVAKVVLEGPVSSMPLATTLTKAGKGTLEVKSVNIFTSDFSIDAGDVYLYEGATLGSNGVGTVRVKYPNGKLYLHNATVDRAIATSTTGGNAGWSAPGIIEAMANTTNILKRSVSRTGDNLRMYSRSNAQLIIAGGLSGNWFHLDGGGEFIFTNKAVSCSHLGVDSGSAIAHFYTSNNICGDGFTLSQACNASIHLHVDDIFKNTHALDSGTGAAATFYLYGTKQHFGNLTTSYDYAQPHLVSTEPGAEVYLNQTTMSSNNWDATGHVSIFKSGSKALTLRKSSSATGTLGVSAGIFRLRKGTQWLNATNIIASATGTFATEADNAFSKTCDITLDGADARLSLGFTGTAVCNQLFMRNAQGKLHPVPAGIYGALDNPNAPNKLANITGTGLLKVTQPRGLLLFVM